MELVPITDIIIEQDRQRDELDFDYIADLAQSIADTGLIHAPTLESSGFVLKTGECRYRAIQMLAEQGKSFFYAGEEIPVGMIPVTRTHLSDEADLFELELEENIRRQNLTPLQRAIAVARLHELRLEKDPTTRKQDTADVLSELEGRVENRYGSDMVSKAILIAGYKDDEDVRAAKTFGEAYKIAKSKNTDKFREVLNIIHFDQEGESRTPRLDQYLKGFKSSRDEEELDEEGEEGYSVRGGFNVTEALENVEPAAPTKKRPRPEEDPRLGRMTAIHASCIDFLPKLPAGSINLILTDPPYGVGADTFGSQVKQAHNYKDDEKTAFEIMDSILKEGARIVTDDGVLYMFCDIRNWARIKEMAEGYGWWVFPKPLIWDKMGQGIAPYPKRGPRFTYEAILLALKPEAEMAIFPDVLSVRPETGKEHAAQKPVDLYVRLAKAAVFSAKSVILDPCAGSGTIFAMNKYLLNGFNQVIGIELDERNYNLCLDTIREIEKSYVGEELA